MRQYLYGVAFVAGFFVAGFWIFLAPFVAMAMGDAWGLAIWIGITILVVPAVSLALEES